MFLKQFPLAVGSNFVLQKVRGTENSCTSPGYSGPVFRSRSLQLSSLFKKYSKVYEHLRMNWVVDVWWLKGDEYAWVVPFKKINNRLGMNTSKRSTGAFLMLAHWTGYARQWPSWSLPWHRSAIKHWFSWQSSQGFLQRHLLCLKSTTSVWWSLTQMDPITGSHWVSQSADGSWEFGSCRWHGSKGGPCIHFWVGIWLLYMEVVVSHFWQRNESFLLLA